MKVDGVRVVRRDDVMNGAVVIAGTRVPVYVILYDLMDGMTVDDIAREMPYISREQIVAAIEWVAEQLDAPEKNLSCD